MSTIRYFDDVPHIVRYGMQKEDEKCWIYFFRNGVRFRIFVDVSDVENTPFGEQWKPLLREHERGKRPLSQWVENQWNPLCDLLISTSMPTLNQLAPKREHWTTLHEYLHTPAYNLRLHASDSQAEIQTRIEKGPWDTAAYNLAPLSKDRLEIPDSIQRYQAKDIRVLNRDKDWRRGPEKLTTSDGAVYFFFLGCQQDTRGTPTSRVMNSSLDTIRARLRDMEVLAREPGTAPLEAKRQVCGVVMDSSSSEDPSAPFSQDSGQGIVGGDECVAGLLLRWVPREDKVIEKMPQAVAGS